METIADPDTLCPLRDAACAEHVRAGLARLQEIEQAVREVQRVIRYALDDLSAALEAQRQLRTQLLQAIAPDRLGRLEVR